MNLDKEKTNVETFKKLYNGFLKNATHNDINSLKAEQDLSKAVTTESYNAFLNSIITDQLFVNSLNGANIQIENEIIKWQDIATVSNAKYHNNQKIDVTLINFNNNKTVTVRVWAYLTLQESSGFQKMVDNMANKNKSYEIVSVSDYYTID